MIAGIVLGDLLFLTLALLGWQTLANSLGGVFSIAKLLAGAYLIWYGLQLWRRPPQSGVNPPAVVRNGVLTGLLITLGDIKAIAFYASLLPLFVDVDAVGPTDYLSITLLTLATVGGIKLGYALLALRVASAAPTLLRTQRLQRVSGGVMLGAGSWLILKT